MESEFIIQEYPQTKKFMELLYKKYPKFRNITLLPLEDGNATSGKTRFKTEFGEVLLYRESLLKGSEPSIMSAVNKEEYFHNMLKSKNPIIANQINILKYKGSKGALVSSKYGEMYAETSGIMDWKELSLKAAVNKKDFWIKRAKDLRKGSENIDYSNTIYKDNIDKPIFRCKIHNYTYTQRPSHHMAGIQGCSYCMKQVVKYSNENIISHKEFLEKLEGVLYVVRLTNKDESFYKVGITKSSRFEYRMNQLRKNFLVEVLYKESSDMVSVFKLEQRFLKEFNLYKYSPKDKFIGYTECLSINPVDHYCGWWTEQNRQI